MAHVHVVIIGLGAFDIDRKQLYDYEAGEDHVVVSAARNISPYLLDSSDIALPIRRQPLCDVPSIVHGNKPADGGFLIIEDEDRAAFLKENPTCAPFLRRFLGADEYLSGRARGVLWLVDAPPEIIRENSGVRRRIEGVRRFRLASRKESTRRRANYPALFDQIRQPTSRYIVVPLHSSERRKYIPFGYFEPNVIVANSCAAIPEATLFHFGVISSAIHMAWSGVVCGRIKSDFRYSNKLVYNNFPWPADVDERGMRAVEGAAQAVLDAREPFLPPKGTSTLADLYDPLTIPASLVRAHAELDRAVDRCYRGETFNSDVERVEHLFTLYERLTAPLIPSTPLRRKRSRA